jgi:ATP-dependent HslUV protease subunit HslV
MRACVNLAKAWKTNKVFRRINATLIVSDGNIVLNLDGEGNVIEIKDGILGIGSGGLYAQCAAKALVGVADELKLSNEEIVRRAMDIATDLCIYSNKNYVVEELKYVRH